jgi:hypothetical protein
VRGGMLFHGLLHNRVTRMNCIYHQLSGIAGTIIPDISGCAFSGEEGLTLKVSSILELFSKDPEFFFE